MDNQVEELVSSRQLEKILNTDAGEVSKLCQKACLKLKQDSAGNLYFSKADIDVLQKVKELYEHTAQIQARKQEMTNPQPKQEAPENFLARAKVRLKNDVSAMTRFEPEHPAAKSISASLNTSLVNFENSIVERIQSILSEKMDGLDEVVVELIRSKTENETLRQKLNELNKENFNLKNENSSYKSVGLGLYVKKNTDDFVL